MRPPGATTSGFMASWSFRPQEEKSEIRPAVARGKSVESWEKVSVELAARAARMASPSALVIVATGMVIFVSPATLALTVPSVLFSRSTAEAPASWALRTLVWKLQSPRRTITALPVKVPEATGWHIRASAEPTAPAATSG